LASNLRVTKQSTFGARAPAGSSQKSVNPIRGLGQPDFQGKAAVTATRVVGCIETPERVEILAPGIELVAALKLPLEEASAVLARILEAPAESKKRQKGLAVASGQRCLAVGWRAASPSG
jgi:hypothetical protein